MKQVGNTKVEILNGHLEDDEIHQYIAYLENAFPNEELASLTLVLDNEYVDMQYTLRPASFERIRRITGYLVGTLEHFNDGKIAEEAQRVKHTL